MVRPQAGYSLAELLLAIGILAISVLSVLALSLRIAAASQKSNDLMVGEMMVDRLLDRVVAEVRNDKPPGKKAKFWGTADHLPWSTGKFTADKTEFEYEIRARTLVNAKGDTVGSSSSLSENRLKKVDVVVHWWDSKNAGRPGYGRLTTQGSRLVSEAQTQ